MKINGQEIAKPVEELLVLPRGDSSIVFYACAVEMDEFTKLCPEPKPPVKTTPKGIIPMLDDPGYKQIAANYNEQRLGYLVINSLAPSNIEWDFVKHDDPASWARWKDDLKVAGFTNVEVQRILQVVLDANCLNEAKIERARADFLRGKAAALEATTSQNSEQPSSPSGEPANA